MQKIISIISERPRKIAFLILVGLYVLDLANDIMHGKLGMSILPIGVWSLFTLLFSAICIVLIYCMRGTLKNQKNKTEIGAWGYVWRSFLIYYASLLFSLVTLKLIFGEPFSKAEVPHIMYVSFVAVIVSPFFCWLFFSKDRKGQLMWCVSLIRGY